MRRCPLSGPSGGGRAAGVRARLPADVCFRGRVRPTTVPGSHSLPAARALVRVAAARGGRCTTALGCQVAVVVFAVFVPSETVIHGRRLLSPCGTSGRYCVGTVSSSPASQPSPARPAQPSQLSHLRTALSAQHAQLSHLSSAISAQPSQLSHLSSTSSAQPAVSYTHMQLPTVPSAYRPLGSTS